MIYNTRVSHLIPLIKGILTYEMLPDLQLTKQAAAEELLQCIKEDYATKSLGMRGVDGIQWEPTKAFLNKNKPILVTSGDLFHSLNIELTETGFKIFTDMEYARRQFKFRPPWPDDHLPSEWIKRMLVKAKPHLLKAMSSAAKTAIQRTGGRVVRETIT